jgi:hypothetical protein
MPSMLFIDDCVPDPSVGYGYPRCNALLRHLAGAGIAVSLFPLQERFRREPVATELEMIGVKILCDSSLGSVALLDALKQTKYEAVIISRLRNMAAVVDDVLRCCPTAAIVYDAEAISSQREILYRQAVKSALSVQQEHALLRTELDLIKRAHIVIATNTKDREFLQRSGIPSVIELGHPLDCRVTPGTFEDRRDILFVGSFFNLETYSPNADAIRYFVDEIFPEVNEQLNCNLNIVGYDSHKLSFGDPALNGSVKLWGSTNDLYLHYNRNRLFVVPTRYASGVPWKVHEALAHGLPAVVTPLIASQLSACGAAVLVAGSRSEFIEHIVEAYTNSTAWQALRAESIRAAEAECSVLRFQKSVSNLLSRIRRMH